MQTKFEDSHVHSAYVVANSFGTLLAIAGLARRQMFSRLSQRKANGHPVTTLGVALEIDDVPEEKPRPLIQNHPALRGQGSPRLQNLQYLQQTSAKGNFDGPDATGAESDEVGDMSRPTKASARFISQMRVLRPELLRAMPAYRAFEGCAMAFRSQLEHDLHHKSLASDKIDRFWSHSWHGGRREKILIYTPDAVQWHGSCTSWYCSCLSDDATLHVRSLAWVS